MVLKMAEELDYRKEGHSFSYYGAFLGGFSDSEAPKFELATKREGFFLCSLALNFPHFLWVSVCVIVIASN